MTSPPPREPAEMIGEHYRIEKELGHGGMATVYLCIDVRNGKRVAVKVLRPEVGSLVTRERFFREIAFASELDHPRIPRVMESGLAGQLPYYAMMFIDGESLRDKLNRERRLSVDETIRIAAAIAGPTGYAHERNIVHRDLKPENVVLAGDKVYVLDFGVARAIVGAGGDRLTRTGLTVGTPAYMSPEQVTGTKDLDYRSDIYSLGCMVYEMLAGAPPFTGATPQLLMTARFSRTPPSIESIRDDVPSNVVRAVQTAMASRPADRWQSVETFVDALIGNTTSASGQTTETSAEDESAEVNVLLEKLQKSFAGTYDVVSEMKGGGMSRLFLATDVALRRKVVIKILPPDMISPMMLARFRRESEVTAQLQHPHILPVISAGVKDDLVHYVMPFIEGESLRGVLEREGQLPIPFGARILREVIDALAYAHKFGVIHRDIKPENVLIQDGHAVLADFGIAAALTGDNTAGERLTGTGMSLGTVGYMAPEQALGERNVDARSDIYSVGVVGFEIFSGQPPFTGATDQAILVAHLTKEAPSVAALRPDTPTTIVDSIKKAMEKDPAMRFQSAAEFRDALDAGGLPAAPPQRKTASTPLPPRNWTANRRVVLPLVAILVASILGLLYWKTRGASGSSGRIAIAIAPFDALSSDLALWREGMVDVLARNLDGVGPFVTVSPSVSIKGFAGPSNAKSAKQLAQRTNATYAIFGRLVGSSIDTVRLHGGFVNAVDGKTWETDVRDSTVEATAAKFTIALLQQLGKSHRIGAARQSSFGSTSIEALRAFLQGEQFYRRTSWDSAATSYARAIRFDTSFAIALRREAQVVGWQKDGKDSVARALWISAGKKNHGLTPRDSMLVAADSISAALAPVLLDSMDWQKVTRLFQTVNTAASRYPGDPEVWYAVGEARFHYGWASILNVTDRTVLDAFNRSISLDSAFAPSYPHAIELAFSLDGAAAGRRYAEAYLRGNPTDKEAEGISIVDRVARGNASNAAETDSIIDQAPASAIMAAYFILRHWPDTAQTALRLLQSVNRRPRSSPTFVEDSTRLWNYMPLQLAYHGRMAESHLIIGNRPSRMFVEMALLAGIPPDTATRVTRDWVDKKARQAFFALPWFASQSDSTDVKRLIARADSEAAIGGPLARRSAKYRASSARAYLSLTRHDTASAIKQFTILNDTLCIACYLDRLETAKLLASRGRFVEAEKLLSNRVYNLITPVEVWIAFERAQVSARLGHREEALRSYQQVVAAWATGDREIQHFVSSARAGIARLGGRPKSQ